MRLEIYGCDAGECSTSNYQNKEIQNILNEEKRMDSPLFHTLPFCKAGFQFGMYN